MNNKSSVRERRRMDSRQSGERALNQHTLSIRRILAPTDLTSTTSKVVDYAVAFARRFGAELILLHVYEAKGNADYSLNVVDDTIVDESRERAEDALRELCGEVSETYPHCVRQKRCGKDSETHSLHGARWSNRTNLSIRHRETFTGSWRHFSDDHVPSYDSCPDDR
jgi:hypothetical protein